VSRNVRPQQVMDKKEPFGDRQPKLKVPYDGMSVRWAAICTTVLPVALLLAACMSAAAQEPSRENSEPKTAAKPLMAIVPPTIHLPKAASTENIEIDPVQIMSHVVPRVSSDAVKRKWPFRILPPDTVGKLVPAATGTDRKFTDEVDVAALKPLAEKIDCRYLAMFRVNELVGATRNELFSHTLHARAMIDLQVYDRETDAIVWQITQISETRHPMRPGNVSLRREQDGALNAALTKALEPFAKGLRTPVDPRPVASKSLEVQKANIIIMVQKVLSDGKRVLLDAGKGSNLQVGDILKSVESDLEVKVVEVLDNGSIAEVTAGTPEDREVLKHK
jgi:hypothetical protein